jgi:probable HAF family extracellular repeat protein
MRARVLLPLFAPLLAAAMLPVSGDAAGAGDHASRWVSTRVCACAAEAHHLGLSDRGDVIWTKGLKGFVWRNGTTTELGTVVAINGRGQVIGRSEDIPGGGFMWQDGLTTPLAGPDESVQPNAIDERGRIVGAVERANSLRAFLWEDGTMRDLGTLRWRSSSAVAINERGQVAGSSGMQNFVWSDGTMSAIGRPDVDEFEAPPDRLSDRGHAFWADEDFVWRGGRAHELEALGGKRADAIAMNRRGEITGWFRNDRWETHAFLWTDGALQDLGTLGGGRSLALALNDSGRVVGVSETPGGAWRAFLWEAGAMTAVGDFRPAAINEKGQILGTSGSDLLLWTRRDGD